MLWCGQPQRGTGDLNDLPRVVVPLPVYLVFLVFLQFI